MPPVKKVGGNARIVIKSLIDSNVIANWLIFHSLLAQKQTTKEKNDFIEQQRTNSNKYIKTFYQSYEFVEHFVCRENKGFEFYYSPLVMTEVLSVLFEKYILRYMDRNFIPIEEFYRLRKEKFPKGTYLDIYLKNKEYFNKLKKHAKIARESKELFGIAGVFISEHGLLCNDAHLLAQAVYQGCKYFITNDSELLEKFGKSTGDIKPPIIAVSPARFINENRKKWPSRR